MIISTTENIGKNYEVIGIVKGTTVNSRHIGKDIGASFKTIVGGEIKGYTEMIEEAQKIATERMVSDAERMNSEITAYGTAVKFIKTEDGK